MLLPDLLASCWSGSCIGS